MANSTSLAITFINKAISYMKAPCDGIITKDLFIKVRDTFPFQYRKASQFYNTYVIKEMIKYSEDVVNKIARTKISNLDSYIENYEDVKLTLNNQYQSLYKAIDDSYDNINKDAVENIIDHVSDVESKTLDLRLIIKGLIILQAIYNMTDVLYTSIENNNKFSYLEEHKGVNFSEILEHMIETNKTYECDKEELSNEDINLFTEQLNKKIMNKLMLLESEDDSIEFTEEDLFEDDYDSNHIEGSEISYDSTDLNTYIHKLYYKAMYMLKDILNKIIDTDYDLLPNIDLLMYWAIIILMHYCLKF